MKKLTQKIIKPKITILKIIPKNTKLSYRFNNGFTIEELRKIYTEWHWENFIKNKNKYFLFEIISEKPFVIGLRLFNDTGIKDEIILKINNSNLIMKLAIILGLETNEDVNPVKYLSWMENDEKYPHTYDDWKLIKRFIKNPDIEI